MRAPAFVLCVALSATGCIPIPHVEQDAPALSGTLMQNGRPVAGVRVRVATKAIGVPFCDSASQETRTGPAGQFTLDRVSHIEPVIPLLAMESRFTSWALCFDLPDGTHALWAERGYFGGPERQILTCELKGPTARGTVQLADDSPKSRFLTEQVRDLAASHPELVRSLRLDPALAPDVCHVHDVPGRRRAPLPPVQDVFP